MTQKQRELLDFIIAFTDERGHCPSMDEMRLHLGVASKSNAFRLLAGLEAQGWVRKVPHMARAIEVVRRPTAGPSPYSDTALNTLSDPALSDLIAAAGIILAERRKVRAA